MSDMLKTKRVIKGSASLYLRTPLLLRSGYGDEFADSCIEKTGDGEFIHINGYVWASFMRRCLERIEGGDALAQNIGKYNGEEGVSPLWCESSFIPVREMGIRPGNAIDRQYGTAKQGALFSDEIVPPGLEVTLNWNYFPSDEQNTDDIKVLFLGALWVMHAGVENIGGGWSYGFGRFSVKDVRIKCLNLTDKEKRKYLWKFGDALSWTEKEIETITKITTPTVIKSWKTITVNASTLPGQMLAVHSSYPVLDPGVLMSEYPDSFVYRGYRIESGNKIKTEYVIPGRTIRQALLSVPIERKLRTEAKPEDIICNSLAELCMCDTCIQYRKNSCKKEDSPQCGCLKCAWFGSPDRGGIIAVTDAIVSDGKSEIVHRIHLCEHSMQNINLFSGEYLTEGTFSFDIIIDSERGGDKTGKLIEEILWVLAEMKEGSSAPDGWHRIGATSTCTGQLQVLNDPEPQECGVING